MQVEKFNAAEYSIINIFARENIPFYVPIYQRKYNWTYEVEIEELIEDLENFYEESKGQEGRSYYLGNIVVKAEKNIITEQTEKYILIDGQQRLTTAILFLNYLRFSLNEIEELKNDKSRLEKVEAIEKVIFLQKEGVNGKEKPIKIENPSAESVLSKIIDRGKDGATNKETKESNYYKNYVGISERLKIKTVKEWDKWLNIFKNIKIALITIGEKDKEISVFESINSKGLPLNTLDLIKNYLFLIAENNNFAEEIKEKIDRIMSDELEEVFITKGDSSKDIDGINRFFAAYITIRKYIDPAKEKKILYKEFKSIVPVQISLDDFDNELNILEDTISNYKNIRNIANEFKNSVHVDDMSKSYLADSKMNLYLSLFLILENKVKKSLISLEEEKKIYSLLDLHNLSLIVSKKGNKDNRFIFRYINEINGDITFESLKKFLTNNPNNKSRLTTNEEFKNALETNEIYKSDSKIAKYLLYRIENKLREESDEFINFAWTLDHIFPQNDKNWINNFNNKDYKNKFIHLLGNLTLIKKKLNSEMGNASWDKKKTIYLKSSLKINKFLIENNINWNINEDDNSVIKWTDFLLEKMQEIWDFDVMNEVVTEFDQEKEKENILTKLNKLSIADAIKFAIYFSENTELSLEEIKNGIIDLVSFIEENEIDIKIQFSKDKISTGGWMTERIYSNQVGNENNSRFEKPMFIKNKTKYSLTKYSENDI